MCVSSGPEGTSFDGGVFVTELIFPTDYPLSPPKMRFISDMFHPNGKHFAIVLCRWVMWRDFAHHSVSGWACVYLHPAHPWRGPSGL